MRSDVPRADLSAAHGPGPPRRGPRPAAAGMRLPSVRVLSRELVVNPNTIARAYTELEREGVLNTRQGLGVFVAEPQDDLSAAARRERLAAALDRFLTEAVHLGFSRRRSPRGRRQTDPRIPVRKRTTTTDN